MLSLKEGEIWVVEYIGLQRWKQLFSGVTLFAEVRDHTEIIEQIEICKTNLPEIPIYEGSELGKATHFRRRNLNPHGEVQESQHKDPRWSVFIDTLHYNLCNERIAFAIPDDKTRKNYVYFAQ